MSGSIIWLHSTARSFQSEEHIGHSDRYIWNGTVLLLLSEREQEVNKRCTTSLTGLILPQSLCDIQFKFVFVCYRKEVVEIQPSRYIENKTVTLAPITIMPPILNSSDQEFIFK